MKLNLSKIESNLLSCFNNHWVEAMLGFCFFIMFILSDKFVEVKENIEILRNVMCLFPFFFAVTYMCNQLFTNRLRFLYYLSLLFFVPAFFIPLNSFILSVSYAFTLLLSFFMLLLKKGRQNNITFARTSMQTIIHLIVSLFIGHVMVLAISAIIGSLIYIFNFDWHDWFEYTYISALFIVIPLVFCHLQDTERFRNMPRFMDIILTYILSPAIIIYTGILYLYFITIAIHWELPKGKIGYMVLAFIIFALGGKMCQFIVSRRYYDWFYSHFSFIAIPPLIIFWIGTLERITTYSFTASRVYLLAAGVLMTLYILLLLSKRWGSYQLMLVISICGIAALTYIPGINARSIGIYAQENRLKEYIKKLDAWDAENRKLKREFADMPSSEKKDVRELQESYHYLKRELGTEYVESKYGLCDSPTFIPWKNISLEREIDVEEYVYYHPFSYSEYDFNVENGICTLTRREGKEKIMEFNINERLDANPALLAKENKDQQELLVWKNEKYLVVLEDISYEKRAKGYYCTGAYVNAIFSRKQNE